MSEPGRVALLESAVSVACEAGEILIREQQGDSTMGFVESGVVQVEVAGRPVALFGRGELFGEMALVLARTCTARVLAQCIARHNAGLALESADEESDSGQDL